MGISKTIRNQRVTTPTSIISSPYSCFSSQLFNRFKISSQISSSNQSLKSHQIKPQPNMCNLQVPIVPVTSPSSLSPQTTSRRIKKLPPDF
jgi:hypothetical protein